MFERIQKSSYFLIQIFFKEFSGKKRKTLRFYKKPFKILFFLNEKKNIKKYKKKFLGKKYDWLNYANYACNNAKTYKYSHLKNAKTKYAKSKSSKM